MTTNYTEQANDFLTKYGVEFSSTFKAFKKYFPDDEQARNVFEITLKRGEKVYSFPFGSSINESCKATPLIESDEKCEIYAGWSFGVGEKIYFSYKMKTDYPTLRKILAGEMKAGELINSNELKREHDNLLKKFADHNKKFRYYQRHLPHEFKDFDGMVNKIEHKISQFIENAKIQTTLFKQADKIEHPTAYDVLACLTKYDVGTFENFCSEFGYDTDSRKAEKTYKDVCKEWENVKNLFGDCLEELAEIQ